jgi:regulator of sigma E protease
MVSYLFVILLIGLLILVHELGHLAAAHLAGIPVARFSVGFGPALWRIRVGAAEYRLAAIPLGGYVTLGVESMQRLFEIPAWKRLAFFAGGPLANLLLPLLSFAALNVVTQGLTFAGVTIAPIGQTWHILSQILTAVTDLWGRPAAVVGGIGLVIEGSSFVGLDGVRAMQFAIFMSLNFAVLNLLPIPVLDGGRILLLAFEHRVRHRRRLHVALALVGWLIIVGLTVYVTAVDVGRYWIS